jgi:hypothetical protein
VLGQHRFTARSLVHQRHGVVFPTLFALVAFTDWNLTRRAAITSTASTIWHALGRFSLERPRQHAYVATVLVQYVIAFGLAPCHRHSPAILQTPSFAVHAEPVAIGWMIESLMETFGPLANFARWLSWSNVLFCTDPDPRNHRHGCVSDPVHDDPLLAGLGHCPMR